MQKKYSRTYEQIQEIVADTERFFEQEGIDGSLRMKVDLSLEELFVNMVNYNTETDEDILIEMRAIENGVEVSLTDFDVERFDPTLSGDVDVDLILPDGTKIGDIGVFASTAGAALWTEL